MKDTNKKFLEELLQGCFRDMPYAHQDQACQEANKILEKQLQQFLKKLPEKQLQNEMLELDDSYNALSSEEKFSVFLLGMQFGARLMVSLLEE